MGHTDGGAFSCTDLSSPSPGSQVGWLLRLLSLQMPYWEIRPTSTVILLEWHPISVTKALFGCLCQSSSLTSEIPDTGCFSPVAGNGRSPLCLDTARIPFTTELQPLIYHGDRTGQHPLLRARIVHFALAAFFFHGVKEYLGSLVDKVDTRHVSYAGIAFSHQR